MTATLIDTPYTVTGLWKIPCLNMDACTHMKHGDTGMSCSVDARAWPCRAGGCYVA